MPSDPEDAMPCNPDGTVSASHVMPFWPWGGNRGLLAPPVALLDNWMKSNRKHAYNCHAMPCQADPGGAPPCRPCGGNFSLPKTVFPADFTQRHPVQPNPKQTLPSDTQSQLQQLTCRLHALPEPRVHLRIVHRVHV